MFWFARWRQHLLLSWIMVLSGTSVDRLHLVFVLLLLLLWSVLVFPLSFAPLLVLITDLYFELVVASTEKHATALILLVFLSGRSSPALTQDFRRRTLGQFAVHPQASFLSPPAGLSVAWRPFTSLSLCRTYDISSSRILGHQAPAASAQLNPKHRSKALLSFPAFASPAPPLLLSRTKKKKKKSPFNPIFPPSRPPIPHPLLLFPRTRSP